MMLRPDAGWLARSTRRRGASAVHRMLIVTGVASLALTPGALLFGVTARAQAPPQANPAAGGGAQLFEQHCATCHTSGDERVPTVASLRQRSRAAILDALTTGVMRPQGEVLTDAERQAVAGFIGQAAASVPAVNGSTACRAETPFNPNQVPLWGGWSPDPSNSRFQLAPRAGLSAATVPRLTLKWAFGFPDGTSVRAQPTVAGGRVFTAGQDGSVYSLDASTGCEGWQFKAKADVRTAIVVGPAVTPGRSLAIFGDGDANVYALDAVTGRQLWMRNIDAHPSARVTGSPVLLGSRVYVAVSSAEEGQGGNATYECCTFRGSVVALDSNTGGVLWKTYTIADEPKPTGRNKGGAVRRGPSGAAIWSTPTLDMRRARLYVATGNMYTEPAQPTSNAVLALDLLTGRIVWSAQMTPNDVFVVGCNQPNAANCPEAPGPDFDFGNSPILTRAQGRDVILIGQKSGIGWALDPENRGAVLWQYRAGTGTALGGMEFGSAADNERVYFPVADGNRETAGELHAVHIGTGERVWRALPRPVVCGQRGRGCTPAILAAITVIPGVVFAGANDGGIRAYSTGDGSILWEFNSNREFTTVNGVPAKGGSISGGGPAVAGGMLYVNSGYGSLGGRAGNVLLAFGLD